MATPPDSVLSEAPLVSKSNLTSYEANQEVSLVILPTDGELLMLFTQEQDEAAFDRLVERHGGMVWRVCRSVLLAQQDVEDAYQATFLLLASKAKQIHANQSAAGWLYRVAHRTALATKRLAKRRREESLEAEPAAPPEEAFPNLVGRQMVTLMLEELHAMPKKYQTPLVMRYLEGQSRRSIADQTDMTVAAVQGKLARGKQMLRSRLVRRGVSLSVAMGVVGAASRSTEAANATLITQTAADCHALVAGSSSLAASSSVLALYQEGTRAMFVASMTKPTATIAAASLALALWVGGGVGAGESTNLAPEPMGAFQLSAMPHEENAEMANPATVLLTQADTSSPTKEHATRELQTKPTATLVSGDAVFIPHEIPGMKFGDMAQNGKKLTDAEQSELLEKMWAKRASKIPNLRLNNRPTMKELHTQHTYWETRYDALKNKIDTIQRLYGSKPTSELSPDQQMEVADAAVLSAEVFHARAEALRLERELMLRATEESAGDKESSFSAIVPGKIAGSPSRPPIENGEEVELWASGTKKAVREYRDGRLVAAVESDESGNQTYVMEDRGPTANEPSQNQSYQQHFTPPAVQWNQQPSGYSSRPVTANRSQSIQPNTQWIDTEPKKLGGLKPIPVVSQTQVVSSSNDSTISVDEVLTSLKSMIHIAAGDRDYLKQVWGNITQRLDDRFNSNEKDKKAYAEKLIDQLSGEELFILQNDLTLLKSYGFSKRNLDRHLATSEELLHYWMMLDGQKDSLDSGDPNKVVYSPRVVKNAKPYVDQITKIRASIEEIEAKIPPQEVQATLAAAVRKNQDKIVHRQHSGSLEIKNLTDQQTKDFQLLQVMQAAGHQAFQPFENSTSGSPNRQLLAPFQGLAELVQNYDHSVEELQEALNQQLDPSPELDVDGDYGPLTKAAVRKFQEKSQLPPTGFADEATRKVLGLNNKLFKPVLNEEKYSITKEVDQPTESLTSSLYPVIVSTTPAQGATDVDPELSEVRVTFDRDMQKGMSWTGGPPHMPEIDSSRKSHWVDDRTCVIPVKLKKGTFYRLGINAKDFNNFKSTDGMAAVHDAIWFTTEGAKRSDIRKTVRPKIKKVVPADGDQSVDPNTKMIRVTFDMPMGGGMSWTRVGDGSNDNRFPNGGEGRAKWGKDGRTCTLPVALEEGKSYAVGINASHAVNFQSKWGVPVEATVIRFKTGEPLANDTLPTEETFAPVSTKKPVEEKLSIAELNQRGWQAFYQGKNVEAEADFREILSRDEKHLAAINGLGFALLNQGKHEEAKPLFKSYLKRDKKAIGPMNGLARCLKAEGNLDGAIKVWERGVKIAPGPTALTSGLAFAYLEKEEHAKAIPFFETLVKSDPKNTFYSDGLAKAKAALGEQPEADANKGNAAGPEPTEIPRIIERGDGKADGKKSLGGSGHLVKFTLPDGVTHVRAVRIHGSRYGTKKAPREDFEISFLSEDRTEILAVEHAAYGLFRRGKEKWTTVRLPDPIELPKTFWVALDFDPGQTKGIYLSYDTETGGTDSMIGLAQDEPTEHRPVDTGGDWMVGLLPVRD